MYTVSRADGPRNLTRSNTANSVTGRIQGVLQSAFVVVTTIEAAAGLRSTVFCPAVDWNSPGCFRGGSRGLGRADGQAGLGFCFESRSHELSFAARHYPLVRPRNLSE